MEASTASMEASIASVEASIDSMEASINFHEKVNSAPDPFFKDFRYTEYMDYLVFLFLLFGLEVSDRWKVNDSWRSELLSGIMLVL